MNRLNVENTVSHLFQVFKDRLPGRDDFLRAIPKLTENTFWFLVLVSWLPIVAGLSGLLAPPQIKGGLDFFLIRPDFVSFILVAVGILGAGLAHYRAVTALCILPSLFNLILGAGKESLGVWNGTLDSWIAPLGLLVFIISAGCFVVFGRIRSPAVALFLLLAAVEAFSGMFPLAPNETSAADAPITAPAAEHSEVFLTFGRLFQAYHLSLLDLAFVAAIIVLGRFVFLLWMHNRRGWQELDKSVLLGAATKTAWLSVPFFVLVLVLGWFWSGVGQELERRVVSQLQPDNPKISLIDALRNASALTQKDITDKSKAALDEAAATAKNETKELVATVMPKVRASFPDYLMKLRGCSWYDIFCHVMNGIKSVVNSIYRTARDAALNALASEFERADALARNNIEEGKKAAQNALEKFRAQSTGWADVAIVKAFSIARLASIILSIIGFIVCIKTVMVILSRILYQDAPNNLHCASLRLGDKRKVSGAPKVLGNEVQLPITGDTYVALGYEVRNAVVNVAIPQPSVGLIGRVLAGRYVLGRLRSSTLNGHEASIVVNSPSELVVWKLKAGDEVIIRYSDLVAFSDTVRLASAVNLSLQATVFGRFIFYKAIGPGMIIMQTEGEAVAGRERDASESRRASALKAWELDAGFQIQSNLDWLGVYFAPYNIRKEKEAFLVYDAGPRNTRWSSVGLIKAVRTFLLPF